jgi:3-carboxy-cis,cis-muconate cycloisomerase
VGAVGVLAAATIAPNLAATLLAAQVGEHERAAGAWQAEWPVIPALALVTSGALAAIVDIAEGLEVDAGRMRANLDASGGQIMAEAVAFALAPKLGKQDAHHVVEQAVKRATKERRPFKEVVAKEPQVTALLSPDEIEKLFDPLSYQGMAQSFIDRLLASTKK